jgi:hypothetical protein
VSAQLLVDVMEVISESLWADAETVTNLIAVFTFRKHAHNISLLFRQRRYRKTPNGSHSKNDPSKRQHNAEQGTYGATNRPSACSSFWCNLGN